MRTSAGTNTVAYITRFEVLSSAGRCRVSDERFLIRVSSDFSVTPGHRYRRQGEWSGEQFREAVLKPAFERAMRADARLRIELAGTQGYATSFLEEAFGGLASQFGADTVERHLELVFEDNALVVDEILGYIRAAQRQSE